jgi:hypothetical protein
MESVCKVIDVWTSLSTHVRMRDRSVKILQYGAQMMLGFYATKYTEETLESLKLLKRTASTSRKAFWLLKSINHFTSLVTLTQSLMKEFSWGLLLDTIEQLFLALYYFTENIVFWIRVKSLKMEEDDIDSYVNWTWFMGDFACFLAAILRLCTGLSKAHEKDSIFQNMKLSMTEKFSKFYSELMNLSIVSC